MLVHVMEPLWAVSTILGLKGYRFTGERVMALSCFSKIQYYSYFSIAWIFTFYFLYHFDIRKDAFVIFYLTAVVIVLSGITNISWFWVSNVRNSKTIIKIFSIFDSIECILPELNGYAHRKNNRNRFVHLFEIFLGIFVLYEISGGYVKFAFTLSYIIYCFATNFILYQFCNLMYMTTSYVNTLDVIVWYIFKKTHLNKKHNNALMDLLKIKIVRCTEVDCSDEKILSRVDLLSVQKMYESLMDIVDLVNRKYDTTVSYSCAKTKKYSKFDKNRFFGKKYSFYF